MIDTGFHEKNNIFVLLFENETQGTNHKRYYLPTVETKSYNVMIDEQKLFDQPVENDLRTYDSIATDQVDYCKTVC